MKTCVYALIGVLGSFLCTEAAVTGWTNPVISGANGDGVATPSIPENTTVGTTGVTIAATAAGTKTYAIASQTPAGKLTIDATTGLLFLASGQSFDFETEPVLKPVITCVDADGTPTTGTATVTLSILDIDENPKFASASYTASITDGATEGTLLITVKATAYVTTNSIVYSITDGNTNNDFSISGSTGAITVAMGKTLNRTVTSEYTLKVQALDNTLIGTTTVRATVTALNSGSTVAFISVIIMFFAMLTSFA